MRSRGSPVAGTITIFGGNEVMIYKYAHPEFFSDWEKPDLESLNGEIILYGAGRRGSVAAHCLKNRRIDFICFCDSDEKKQGIPFCGHDVISPESRDRIQ